MADNDPVETVRRYHQAIADLDFDAIGSFFAEDALYLSAGTGDLAGREAIVAAFRSYFDRWNGQVAEDVLSERIDTHKARSLWRLRAVEAATGAPFERSGEEIVVVGTDGLIRVVEVRDDA